MTATSTGATKTKKPPTIRPNLPAPSSPEGELFHYTPEEAALWLPFVAKTLRLKAINREIPHVNNGNTIWFSGLNIRAISLQFTVLPVADARRAKAPAAA